MSRRGLYIRLLIFVPLFAYFGYGAYQKWASERGEEAGASAPNSRKMTLPDGRSIDVIELTPEQAEQQYGIKLPPEAPKQPVEVTKAQPAQPATVSDGSKQAPVGDPATDGKGPEAGAPAVAPAMDGKAAGAAGEGKAAGAAAPAGEPAKAP